MLSHLLFLSMAFGSISAIADLNCTVDGKYASTAFSCEDKQNSEFCEANFGVKGGYATNPERNTKCFGDAMTGDDGLKQGAISVCAKTCAYCCQTPEYTCENKERSLKCDTVSEAMCKDPKWREILAVECPNKCGFCMTGGCVDAAVDCPRAFCHNIDYLAFVRQNCKKTCGYCDLLTTTPAGGITGYTQNPAGCIDTSNSCSAWMKSGFCSSAYYTLENKKQYCAKTCGLC